MARIVELLAVMAGLAGLGVLLRRLGWVRPGAAPKLNTVALYVTVPAGVFLALHVFPIDRSVLGAPALAALLTLVLWAIAELAGRAVGLAPGPRAVFVLAVVFGNTAFIGFPVVAALWGDAGLSHAVLIDQVGAEPLAYTVGAVVAAAGAAGAREKPRWGRELASLLVFPPLVALVAGLVWSGLHLPELPSWLEDVLRWISRATVPIVMISLGLVVRVGSLRAALRPAALVMLLRLVAAPLLALGSARMAGLSELPTKVLTLEFGMPTMMFTLVLALRYGLDAELAAAFISVTLAGALVTLPAWLAALGG
jgi:predicted permease